MKPRVILYVIVGGFLIFYGLNLYLEGNLLWGIILGTIGILIGIQMIRLVFIPDLNREEKPDVDLCIETPLPPVEGTFHCPKCNADFLEFTLIKRNKINIKMHPGFEKKKIEKENNICTLACHNCKRDFTMNYDFISLFEKSHDKK